MTTMWKLNDGREIEVHFELYPAETDVGFACNYAEVTGVCDPETGAKITDVPSSEVTTIEEIITGEYLNWGVLT